MPELSRFFGIIIRMYAEVGAPHHGAHFHAYYQDSVGIFQIDPVEMIAGGLPARQRRFVEAWAELQAGTAGRLGQAAGGRETGAHRAFKIVCQPPISSTELQRSKLSALTRFQ